MAVPFSRPVYPGGSRARRPQETSTNNTNSAAENPITQFLQGRAPIRLDQLSLTSRIAFYALYEAWRLLMDLTQGTSMPHQLPNNARRHTIVNDPAPSNNTMRNLPDVVLDSTQSAQCNPRGNDKWAEQPEASCTTTSQPDIINHVDDEVDLARVAALPDLFIPISNQDHNNQQVPKSSSAAKRTVSTSSDYFSLDGYPSDLEEDDEECIDLHKGGGVNWHKLGSQLCEIASAFEVNYSPNNKEMTESQRQVYQIYRDLKLKTLALSRRDNTSMVGLAKTVFRQVLLSSIWMLLKKIM